MCVAIVVASGVGSRMGADNPKQFVEVYGKPFFFTRFRRFSFIRA